MGGRFQTRVAAGRSRRCEGAGGVVAGGGEGEERRLRRRVTLRWGYLARGVGEVRVAPTSTADRVLFPRCCWVRARVFPLVSGQLCLGEVVLVVRRPAPWATQSLNQPRPHCSPVRRSTMQWYLPPAARNVRRGAYVCPWGCCAPSFSPPLIDCAAAATATRGTALPRPRRRVWLWFARRHVVLA